MIYFNITKTLPKLILRQIGIFAKVTNLIKIKFIQALYEINKVKQLTISLYNFLHLMLDESQTLSLSF